MLILQKLLKIDDTLIRKAASALGLLISTKNERLDATGTVYKVEDVIRVHRCNQLHRLESTQAGRLIMTELGYNPPKEPMR